jgi:hypothetical protein
MKARFKLIKDIPERLKCCPAAITDAKKLHDNFGIFELNPSDMSKDNFTCIHCNHKELNLLSIYFSKMGFNIPFDSIDIDEGEANESNSNRTALSN